MEKINSNKLTWTFIRLIFFSQITCSSKRPKTGWKIVSFLLSSLLADSTSLLQPFLFLQCILVGTSAFQLLKNSSFFSAVDEVSVLFSFHFHNQHLHHHCLSQFHCQCCWWWMEMQIGMPGLQSIHQRWMRDSPWGFAQGKQSFSPWTSSPSYHWLSSYCGLLFLWISVQVLTTFEDTVLQLLLLLKFHWSTWRFFRIRFFGHLSFLDQSFVIFVRFYEKVKRPFIPFLKWWWFWNLNREVWSKTNLIVHCCHNIKGGKTLLTVSNCSYQIWAPTKHTFAQYGVCILLVNVAVIWIVSNCSSWEVLRIRINCSVNLFTNDAKAKLDFVTARQTNHN